ncbi:hypothetical protein GQ607_007336, partial [Colletotrichum asianum]
MDNPPVVDIIRGYHDLFPYAHDFWFDHLTTSVCNSPEKDLGRLREKAMGMWNSFNKVVSEPEVAQSGPETLEKNADPQLARLFNFLGPAKEYYIFKNGESEGSRKLLRPLNAAEDPTRLSEAYLKYSSLLESLLNNNAALDAYKSSLTTTELREFKQRHAQGAFKCRWAGCTQGWFGFKSERERDDHERSHKPHFRCSDPDCLLVFDSKRALRNHKLQYHVKESDWVWRQGTNLEQDATPEQQAIGAYVSVPLGEPKFKQPWHTSPNFEIVRQNACELANKTQRRELVGILERMTQPMKDELKRDKKEPLEYHFRKKAIGDFRQLQDEEMAKRTAVCEPHDTRPAKVRKMIKNTARVERAEERIDSSLSEVIEIVKRRPELNPEAEGKWTDG